jgi:hypothetical protein
MNKVLLERYSDYLKSSFSQTTATGLSGTLEGQISHDRITRFLSRRDFDSKQLWLLVKPVIRQYERDDGVIIFDDTIEEKPDTRLSRILSLTKPLEKVYRIEKQTFIENAHDFCQTITFH